MFWKKRFEEPMEEFVEEIEVSEIEEPMNTGEVMRRAVKADREYIDIQKEGLPIDVIEMMHFFNELPSRLPKTLLQKNEVAIDYFRDFTAVYVGNVFEFYQTMVLFYYKNWRNPQFPFEGTQLEFAFSKVAQNIFENLTVNVHDAQRLLDDLVDSNYKAFYFHEDNVELLASRFMKRTIAFIPQLEYSAYYSAIEHEFVTLGNEVYRDILDNLYELGNQDFGEYDTVYALLHQNDEFIHHPDYFKVRALFYYPIQHLEIIRVMQFIRLYRLQQVLYQGLEYDLTTHVENIKTVVILEAYMFSENDALYSQNKVVHSENKRFLTLFFDEYYFENKIDDAKDSPKVRHCINDMMTKVKKAVIEGKFDGELEILIRKAYYEHKLFAGS